MPPENDRLSEQIHLLGDLLGETIVEQEGRGLFDLVEEVRASAKAHRAGDEAAGERLLARIEALPLAEARGVTKAFATYFKLVNLAEDEERVRVLRRREREAAAAGAPAGETIAAAVRELGDAGMTPDDLQALLDRLLVMPVFTAHPTEAKRRTILTKLVRISELLRTLDLESPTPGRGAASARVAARGAGRALADGGDARLPARRDGRGAQRALLLRDDALRPRPRGRARARARRGRALSGAARAPVVPALRQLDGRRPRRQPATSRPR